MADRNAGREQAGGSGVVAGYIRVSRLPLPTGLAPDERALRYAEARAARVSELATTAALRGDTVDAWYADIDRSGRGAALAQRGEFLRLWKDARAGRIRRVYVRDMSRLFRDVMLQETWLKEMAVLGVAVAAADMPTDGETASQRMARQQIGAVHEFMASRTSEIVSMALRTKVVSGRWVGSGHSRWGLRYDVATGGFSFDADTADRIRLVFEVFVICGGLPTSAARVLNRMLDEGHPRATPTPHGLRWAKHHLKIVSHSHYRRCATYAGETVPAPHLIPEVVSPALVTEADKLLARPLRDRYAARGWRHALESTLLDGSPNAASPQSGVAGGLESDVPHMDHGTPVTHGIKGRRKTISERPSTYRGLLRCGYCGGPLVAGYLPSSKNSADLSARAVSWHCPEAVRDRLPKPARCATGASAVEARLDALVGRGLREALLLWGARRGLAPSAPWLTASQTATIRDRELRPVIGTLEDRAGRIAALTAAAPDEVRHEHPAAATPGWWDKRFAAPWPPQPPLDPASWCDVSASAADLWPEASSEVAEGREALWGGPGLEPSKRALLGFLGVTVIVWVLNRQREDKPLTKGLRHLGGRVCMLLCCPRIGMSGPNSRFLIEADEAWRTFSAWQHSTGRIRVGSP